MKIAIAVGLVALSCACCWAADSLTPMDVKPGLWQAAVETPGLAVPANLPGIPPEALARMTPQQREQIESALKGRGGASAMTTRFCMSPDQVKQSRPVAPVDSSCEYKVVSSSAAKQQLHLDCKKDAEARTGDVTMERVDSEHINMTTTVQTSAAGQPMTVKTSLKWLAADCGAVKPAGAK